MAGGDDIDWWMKKMSGILADPKSIKTMKPGESWVAPNAPGDPRFINDAEAVRPRGIALHAKGGKVMPKMTKEEFENSPLDIEKKGVKEGSREDEALDRKQMAAATKGKGIVKMASGGVPAAAVDPRTQLSAGYWDRVRRQAAVDRAAQPDTRMLDQRTLQQNQYLAPPGPSGVTPAAGAIPAYNKGGMVKHGSSTHVSCKAKG
jgi:hypothetical protein